jgi:hypothetical protein
MSKDDRPLHPDGMNFVYQHPIKGCVCQLTDADYVAYATDYRQGTSDDDRPFRTRLELGDWLVKQMPDIKHRVVHQLFIDAIYKPDFEGDSIEAEQLRERVDMAQSVMDAGGACTYCGVEPDGDKYVDHRVGCEVVSWALWSVMHQVLNPDGEPSLADVVRDAEAQIERMA